MAFATTRVGVHLINQFAYSVHTITDHLRRVTARCSNQSAADNQEAVVMTRQVTLHQDFVTEFNGCIIGRCNLFACMDVDGDAFPLVAVPRFHHCRATDFLDCVPGIVGAYDRTA